jgi:hypothetical protein
MDKWTMDKKEWVVNKKVVNKKKAMMDKWTMDKKERVGNKREMNRKKGSSVSPTNYEDCCPMNRKIRHVFSSTFSWTFICIDKKEITPLKHLYNIFFCRFGRQ